MTHCIKCNNFHFRRVSPWSFYKYASFCFYWMCNLPIVGAGFAYGSSFFFNAIGLRGKTNMSQVYSVYEVALFHWDEVSFSHLLFILSPSLSLYPSASPVTPRPLPISLHPSKKLQKEFFYEVHNAI